MQRNIAGLDWRPYGPNHYELAGFPQISVTFLGDRWFLHVPDAAGEPRMQGFDSRDEACQYVATALGGGFDVHDRG